MSNLNFGICSWKTAPKRAVNFEVAPEVTKLTYPKVNQGQALKRVPLYAKRPKKPIAKMRKMNVTTISMKKLDHLVKEAHSNDMKLKTTHMAIDNDILKLCTKLNQGLKYAKSKCDLHSAIMKLKMLRAPTHGFEKKTTSIPLQRHPLTPSFTPGERLLEDNLESMEELKNMLEMLDSKHGSWHEKFPEYDLENFTIMDQYGVVHSSPCFYMDANGRSHDTAQVYVTDWGIIHDTLRLNQASSRHHCRYVGHSQNVVNADLGHQYAIILQVDHLKLPPQHQ
jgi:hypothetical protein